MAGKLAVFCALIFLGLVLVAAFNMTERGSPVNQTPTTSQEIIRVTAPELNADYEANEVAADEKYSGRTLRVVGQVKSIDKDAWGAVHIVMADDTPFSGTLLGVDAAMNTSETTTSVAPRLQRGQAVAVLCTKVRRIIGSVRLDDCEFNLSAAQPRPPNEEPPSASAPPNQSLASPPKLVYSVEPEFPDAARTARKGGSVLVSLTVDDQGSPTDLTVATPAGFGMDEAALKAVGQYRFDPALDGSHP